MFRFGPDITKLCLETLGCLANHVFQEKITASQLPQMTEHFLAVSELTVWLTVFISDRAFLRSRPALLRCSEMSERLAVS